MGSYQTSKSNHSTPESATVRLRVTGGPAVGQCGYPDREGRLLVGRSSTCGLQIPDSRVSREHLEITRSKAVWHVYDLQSSNGTSLNGELIQKVSEIRHGDIVAAADIPMRFEELGQCDSSRFDSEETNGQPSPIDAEQKTYRVGEQTPHDDPSQEEGSALSQESIRPK